MLSAVPEAYAVASARSDGKPAEARIPLPDDFEQRPVQAQPKLLPAAGVQDLPSVRLSPEAVGRWPFTYTRRLGSKRDHKKKAPQAPHRLGKLPYQPAHH